MRCYYPSSVVHLWIWLRTHDPSPGEFKYAGLYITLIKKWTGYELNVLTAHRWNSSFERGLPIRKGMPLRITSDSTEFTEIRLLISAHNDTAASVYREVESYVKARENERR